jgi:hypothetical protein
MPRVPGEAAAYDSRDHQDNGRIPTHSQRALCEAIYCGNLSTAISDDVDFRSLTDCFVMYCVSTKRASPARERAR